MPGLSHRAHSLLTGFIKHRQTAVRNPHSSKTLSVIAREMSTIEVIRKFLVINIFSCLGCQKFSWPCGCGQPHQCRHEGRGDREREHHRVRRQQAGGEGQARGTGDQVRPGFKA